MAAPQAKKAAAEKAAAEKAAAEKAAAEKALRALMEQDAAGLDLRGLRDAIGGAEAAGVSGELVRNAKAKLQDAESAGAKHLPAMRAAERQVISGDQW